eukprot:4326789-Pleurochrysis_carterae.AAC.1
MMYSAVIPQLSRSSSCCRVSTVRLGPENSANAPLACQASWDARTTRRAYNHAEGQTYAPALKPQ